MNNEGRSGIFKTSILLTPTFLQMHKLLNIDSETGPTSNGENQLFPYFDCYSFTFSRTPNTHSQYLSN